MELRNFVLILSVLSILGLTACGSNGLTLLDNVGSPHVSDNGITASSLATGSYVDFGTVTRDYEMFKLQHGTGTPTYVQWIPNKMGVRAGAVLVFAPYDGIDWSDLVIDATWFAKGAGMHTDLEEPTYDPLTSSPILFNPMNPATAAENAYPYSYNNLHVLVVYGRFYTGHDAQNDIEDVKNGLRFLKDQTLVDSTKIGISTESWGGAAALYSVAQLGATYMPKAISLNYPVSDFKKMIDHINVTVPAETATQNTLRDYAHFFDPYYRRMSRATVALAGSPARFDAYRHSQLASINSHVLVTQDDWDTLVPSSSTVDLLASMPLADKTAYFQRHSTSIVRDTFDLSHTQSTEPMDAYTMRMWNATFLITQLTPSTTLRSSTYSSSLLLGQMQHVLDKTVGSNSVFYNKLLNVLCQTNLQMVDLDGVYTNRSGPDLLMALMNVKIPGWAASGAAACGQLQSMPPF